MHKQAQSWSKGHFWANISPDLGNAMPLSLIPLGTIICCMELVPGKGANIARSAGSFAQLMAREDKYATVKLPSGETRMILSKCFATIGAVSNSDHQLVVSGKAGRSRWLGRRPRTRPVAMNPVDHPMGGGEGRVLADILEIKMVFRQKVLKPVLEIKKVTNLS